jgi:hypothetical protein
MDGEERVGGVREVKDKKKTLIPAFSRTREKGRAGAGLHFHPLPFAGEGRVRVFLSHG